jgi:hypothetical protein
LAWPAGGPRDSSVGALSSTVTDHENKVEMDTPQQATVTSRDKDTLGAQRRSIADKRGMVEATWLGPIRARVAWAHGVNANQLFGWLRLYLNAATPVIELTPVLL